MYIVLAFVAVVIAQTQLAGVLPSNGQTYLVRIETAATGGAAFSPSAQSVPGGPVTTTNAGQASTIAVEFRNGGPGGALLTPNVGLIAPITIPEPPSADSYTVVSFLSASTLSVNLCLNNSVLFPSNDQCVPLQPIGSSSGSFINLNTVIITQIYVTNSPTVVAGCSNMAGSCEIITQPSPAFLSQSILPTVIVESISTIRDCSVIPEFIRGTLTCPVILSRVLTANNETAFLTNSVLTSLSTTTFTDLTVPRNGGYSFASPSGPLSGGVVGSSSRGEEAFFTSSSAVSQATYDSFYVAFVNVAHREQVLVDQNGVPSSASNVPSDATVVVQDGVGRVLHFIPELQVPSPFNSVGLQFVELFLTSSPSINVQAVLRAAGFSAACFTNCAFNGSLAASGVSSLPAPFTAVANHYYVVALTTAVDPTSGYILREFDVTPDENLNAGTQEEEIINLIQASQSSAQTGVTETGVGSYVVQPVPAYSGVELFQVSPEMSTAWNCLQISSSPIAPGTSAIFNGTLSGVTIAVAGSGAACPTPTNVAGSPISFGGTVTASTCGRRITILYGRPYTLITPTCTVSNFNSPTCSIGSPTSTVLVGDLSFVGNSFFPGPLPIGLSQFTTTPGQLPQPLTVDIASCNCVQTVLSVGCPSNCDILTAITGSSGSVSGTVSGLSGALAGIDGSVGSVLSRLSGINSTLHLLKSLDYSIKDMIKKRC